jgi:hypothetical protein
MNSPIKTEISCKALIQRVAGFAIKAAVCFTSGSENERTQRHTQHGDHVILFSSIKKGES